MDCWDDVEFLWKYALHSVLGCSNKQQHQTACHWDKSIMLC